MPDDKDLGREGLWDDPWVFDKKEAARLLRTTPRHIERLVDEGRIGHCRVGRFIRFRPDDLVRYLLTTHIAAKREES